MNIFHDKIIDLKPSNVFLTIKQCELQNSKQERRYEIRRASTLIGGETKYQINPTTYRFKSLVLSIYSIYFFSFRSLDVPAIALSSFNFQLFRPTVRHVFTSIRIQSDTVLLFHVHDILYSLVSISV